jgi:hypothetical protein
VQSKACLNKNVFKHDLNCPKLVTVRNSLGKIFHVEGAVSALGSL